MNSDRRPGIGRGRRRCRSDHGAGLRASEVVSLKVADIDSARMVVLARDPDELEKEEEPATAGAERTRRFLEREILPCYVTWKKKLANRPLFCEQASG